MNETLQTIASARSIHGSFSEREVSQQDLQLILDSAIRAANASNRQSYSIVVLDDRDLMQDVCGYQASRGLLFCVDFNRLIALARHIGRGFTPDGLTAFVTGSVDTILAAQTAALAAKALGIDSLFTNGIHRKDLRQIYKRLNLPEQYCFPLIMLLLGYPQSEPEHKRGRVDGPGVVHYGGYQAMSAGALDKMIKTYDDPARQIALNENWADGGLEHYLDWFFTVWTGPDNPEKQQELYDVLRRAGFLK